MSGYHVYDGPSEGYIVVDGLATPGSVVHALERARYQVTRVNLSTGRGTVRHIHTGKSLQVVRGRFGMWSLADGTRRLVRFVAASEVAEQDGTSTLGAPHTESAYVGDIAQPMIPGNEDGYVWEVTEVAESGRWVIIRRTDNMSFCQQVMLDSAGCWRLTDSTRVWFITPLDRQPQNAQGRVTYADLTNRKGLTSCIMRENGFMVGTLFCWDGQWSSAYNEDGKFDSRRQLVEQMLSATSRRMRAAKREAAGVA